MNSIATQVRMHCKMVFNFTVRHDHAFKSCQTTWDELSMVQETWSLLVNWGYDENKQKHSFTLSPL